MDTLLCAGSISKMPGGCVISEIQKDGILLLNEPDDSVRDALTVLLQGEHWSVVNANDCAEMAVVLESGDVVAVISESSLPNCAPEDILERCKEYGVPVIFTGHDLPLQGAVDLIRQGAIDFLDKPFPQARLLDLLERLQNTKVLET